MANPAAILNVLVTADTRKAQAGLAGLNKQLGQSESAASRVGGQFAKFGKVAAVGVAGGLAYAVKKAADFEQQMDSLGSVSGASGKQMEQFRKQAMKAGADTKYSALEAAQAQTELAKGGLKVSQIMKGGLKSALALAAAGEMDLAEAAEATVNAMKLFGLRGKDAMKVADGFATAANKTTADVSDFAMAMKMGGSAAKAAGLSFTETTAELEALAEMGIRNSDAGTSMKAMLTQLAAPTAKQKDLTKALNLEFFDQEGKMKSLSSIAGMLRDRLGEMGDQQRLATVKTLAGTDGMRALLALYDAGPKKMAGFVRGLEKQGTAAKVAAEKQDNFRGKLENLQGSIETIAISVGSKLLPTLTDAAEKLTDLLNNKHLSNAEKLQKLADMLGKAVSDGLEFALKKAGEFGPKIAAAVARGFVRFWSEANPVAKLFGTAALIRLIGGRGALMATGAAIGRFLGIGIGAGAASSASGAGGSAAKGGLLAGLLSGAKTFAKRAPVLAIGVATADGIMNKMSQRMAERSDDLFEALAGKAKKADNWATDLGEKFQKASGVELGYTQIRKSQNAAKDFATELKNIVALNQHISPDRARALREEMNRLGQFSASARKQFEGIINAGVKRAQDLRIIQGNFRSLREGTVRNLHDMREVVAKDMDAIKNKIGLRTAQGRDAVRDNFTSAVHWIKENMSDGKGITDRGGRELERLLDSHSKAGKRALARNFDDVVAVIQATMRRGGKVTKEGLRVIRQLYVEQLKLAGLSPRQAVQEARPNVSFNGGREEGTTGPGHQRGAYISRGKMSGDSVPAMLERGEYVLNRNAVKKIGKSRLDALNFSAAPRFQEGGGIGFKFALGPYSIPPIQYDPNHAGGNSHVHVAMQTVAAAQAIAARMRSMGWVASEAPWAGGLTVSHQDPGHYSGSSFDANTTADETRAEVAALARLLGGGAGGAVAAVKLLKRMVVGGNDSPFKSIVQGALDNTVAAANAKLGALAPAGMGEVGVGSLPGGGKWQETLRAIAQQRGWSVSDWMALVMKESGGNPAAVNPSSGAYGLGQFLGSTKAAYAKYGATSPDGAAQINAMAHYIADRYGSPSNALAFHNAHNWYRKGGLVGMRGGGLAERNIMDRLDLPAYAYSMIAPKGVMERRGYKPHWGPFKPQGSNLSEWLVNTLRYVGQQQRPRQRKVAVENLLGRIEKLGVEPGVFNQIRSLTTGADRAGEAANMAASMTDEQSIMDALNKELERRTGLGQAFPEADQLKMVQGLLGRVEGKSEPEWLKVQLDSLFKLRNRLLKADPIVTKKRDKVSKFIQEAQERLRALVEEIHKRQRKVEQLTREINKMQHRLDAELRKPADERDGKLIARLRDGIKKRKDERQGHRDWLPPAMRRRDTLKNEVIPAAEDQRASLNTLRGNLFSGGEDILGLYDVQGKFSTTEILKELPALGVLGGQIFEVQSSLKRWLPPSVDTRGQVSDPLATAGFEETVDQSAIFEQERLRQLNELLQQQLTESKQRFAVSQRQYQALSPFMGAFAKGGVALVGERGPELAHMPSGTRIHSASDTQTMLQPEVSVQVNVAPGMEWLKRFISVEVEDVNRKQARSARRALPSRGGS